MTFPTRYVLRINYVAPPISFTKYRRRARKEVSVPAVHFLWRRYIVVLGFPYSIQHKLVPREIMA